MKYKELRNYLNSCMNNELECDVIFYDEEIDESFQLHDILMSENLPEVDGVIDDHHPVLIKRKIK